MRLIEEVSVQFSWDDLDHLTYHPRLIHARQPGIHVSDVIRYIAGPEGLGLYKDFDPTEDMPLGVLLGMCWEEGCARLYPNMQWQPEPLKRDGLIGSPDGFDEVELGGLWMPNVDEFKRTLKSRHNHGNVLDNWPWMAQIMAYCKMDPRQPQFGRLHVDWDAGDYRPPRAEYRRYLIRYEKNEIEANWKLLLKYKDKAVTG